MSVPKIVFLVGPTAVGKTRLAVKLAKRLKAEIISCDSMQVYKGMPILSQAPPQAVRNKAPHHLIGTISPSKEYNAARFRVEALRAMRRILKMGAVPIFVGGSGLYIKALIDGLFPAPKADSKFRARMQNIISRFDKRVALHERLSKIDPEAAKRIHPNDSRRVIRALEIFHSTGRTFTELKASTRGLKDEFEIMIIGLTRPREELYKRIDARVDEMLKAGLVNEVKGLMKARVSRTARAVLGFEEIASFLKGGHTQDEAIELLKKNTRNFAKAQATWFNADARIRWFDLSKTKDEEIVNFIWKRLY